MLLITRALNNFTYFAKRSDAYVPVGSNNGATSCLDNAVCFHSINKLIDFVSYLVNQSVSQSVSQVGSFEHCNGPWFSKTDWAFRDYLSDY
jgi:hypothetical protein